MKILLAAAAGVAIGAFIASAAMLLYLVRLQTRTLDRLAYIQRQSAPWKVPQPPATGVGVVAGEGIEVKVTESPWGPSVKVPAKGHDLRLVTDTGEEIPPDAQPPLTPA